MHEGIPQEVLEKLKDGSLEAVKIHVNLDSLDETVSLQLPADSPRIFSFAHSLEFLQAILLNEVPHVISDLLLAVPQRIHYQVGEDRCSAALLILALKGQLVARLNGTQVVLLRPTEKSLDVELQSLLRRIRRSRRAEFQRLFWQRMRPIVTARRLRSCWTPLGSSYR